MGGSLDEPDVAAIAFKEVELTYKIKPVMYLLSVEPVASSFLQYHHKAICYNHDITVLWNTISNIY